MDEKKMPVVVNGSPPTDFVEGTPPMPIFASDHDAAEEAANILIEEPTAKQIFIAWEKLRLLYNGVLVMVVVFVTGSAAWDLIPNLIEAAIVANLCFCVGPVLEGYANCCGMRRRTARWLVFCLGLGIAIGYTVEVANRIMHHLPVWPGFPHGLN